MDAPDAVTMTLPGVPAAAVGALVARLRLVDGIIAAIPGGVREGSGPNEATIILRISPETLGSSPQLLAALGGAIDLLRAGNVESVTLTMPGGAVVTGATSMSRLELGRNLESDRSFDVAVSFADEERPYVLEVVRALGRRGVVVFYDADEDLWGKDLVTYLDGVYRHRSRYVVIFVSAHYVSKQWTRHELRAALAMALRDRSDRILPARFDDSDVPGLPPTVRYADCRQLTPDDLANMITSRVRS
jgi:hypothetical protein